VKTEALDTQQTCGAPSDTHVGRPCAVLSANQNSHPLIGINSPIVISVRVQAPTQSEILTLSEVSASPAYRAHLTRCSTSSQDSTTFSDIVLLLRILQFLFVTVKCTSTCASTIPPSVLIGPCTTSTCTFNKFSHICHEILQLQESKRCSVAVEKVSYYSSRANHLCRLRIC
jgi:hypothetical protein